MITEDYVSFEIAKLLKEKGFNEKVSRWYVTNFPEEGTVPFSFGDETEYTQAPTLQMTMKWLREVHNLEIYPYHQYSQDGNNWWFEIVKFPGPVSEYESNAIYATYEEACEAAIKYCLENLI